MSSAEAVLGCAAKNVVDTDAALIVIFSSTGELWTVQAASGCRGAHQSLCERPWQRLAGSSCTFYTKCPCKRIRQGVCCIGISGAAFTPTTHLAARHHAAAMQARAPGWWQSTGRASPSCSSPTAPPLPGPARRSSVCTPTWCPSCLPAPGSLPLRSVAPHPQPCNAAPWAHTASAACVAWPGQMGLKCCCP